MTLKKIIPLLIFIVSMLSCERDFTLYIDKQGGNPVLYSFIQPNSSLILSLSKSVAATSAHNYELYTDAQLIISRNHCCIKTISYPSNQLWENFSDLIFVENDSIEIQIITNNEIIVKAQTIVPVFTPITQVDTIKIAKSQIDGTIKNFMQLGISFSDSLKIKDYYQLNLEWHQTSLVNNVLTDSIIPIVFSKTDRVFYDPEQGTSTIGNIDFDGLFTDATLKTKEYKIQIQLPYNEFTLSSNDISKKLVIKLSHLNKDCYLFKRSQIIYDTYKQLPIFDPVNIYSNIENGFGMLASFATTSDTIFITN